MDEELKPINKKVAKIIQDYEHVPIMAENFIGSGTPKKMIEDKVDECNAYIGIFHCRWGSVPESDNPKNLSISAIEFYGAKEINNLTLVLISDKEKESDLEKFVKKISDYENGIWRSKYKNRNELYEFVRRWISSLEEHIGKPSITNNDLKIINKTGKTLNKNNEDHLNKIFTIYQNWIDTDFLIDVDFIGFDLNRLSINVMEQIIPSHEDEDGMTTLQQKTESHLKTGYINKYQKLVNIKNL